MFVCHLSAILGKREEPVINITYFFWKYQPFLVLLLLKYPIFFSSQTDPNFWGGLWLLDRLSSRPRRASQSISSTPASRRKGAVQYCCSSGATSPAVYATQSLYGEAGTDWGREL